MDYSRGLTAVGPRFIGVLWETSRIILDRAEFFSLRRVDEDHTDSCSRISASPSSCHNDLSLAIWWGHHQLL